MPLDPVDTGARWPTPQGRQGLGATVPRERHRRPRRVHLVQRRNPRLGTRIESGLWVDRETPPAPGVSGWRLRLLLEKRNITACIPIHTRHETSMVSAGEFVYHGDHLVCPQGKILRQGSFHKRSRTHRYVARHKDCQGLSRQGNPPSAKAETSVLHPDDVLSRVYKSQGTKLF